MKTLILTYTGKNKDFKPENFIIYNKPIEKTK